MITFYDTETCGLHGIIVLIQYAFDDGEVQLHHVWKRPIFETLELIKKILGTTTIGFNIVFDHFHLVKLYNVLSAYHDYTAYPEDIINELAELEMDARDGFFLKPKGAFDIMLHARKGPYQSTMDRSDIRIKRIPYQLAHQVSNELNKRIDLKPIYFARKKTKRDNPWQVVDIEDEPELKDIVLKFSPSNALKALAHDALGKDATFYEEIEIDKKLRPVEYGYAPFAKAVGNSTNWKGAWPDVIKFHIDHWYYHKAPQKYAIDDVVYVRELYDYFGRPEPDDDDSTLAIMVANVRWKGFKINTEKILEQREESLKKQKLAPTAPNRVKDWVWPELSEDEKLVTGGSTKKVVLETIAKWGKDHPAAIKARAVLDARGAQKEVELYDKLLKAGRLHASFKIIGALSTRMSGADKLNTQGIKSTKEVRSAFPLAWDGQTLCGGDFDSFEVVIGIAVFGDKKLEEEVRTKVPCPRCEQTGKIICPKKKVEITCDECNGELVATRKIHALFGQELFEMSYEEVIQSKGTENDYYKKGKSGVFLEMYGGNEFTMQDRLGVDIEQGEKARKKFHMKYKGVGRYQKEIYNDFCSMRQPGGIGSRVEWHEPKNKIESLLGFPRYFTLENKICKTLFQLAERPPNSWKHLKVKVKRRDRFQLPVGAARSALFAAAFAIQSANMRAAANHRIQSTGAGITKAVQRKIWDHQPQGVALPKVMPMNIHDEIMCPTAPDYTDRVELTVKEQVERFRPTVPLIAMEWEKGLKNWAEK